jgi:hypothetical protein
VLLLNDRSEGRQADTKIWTRVRYPENAIARCKVLPKKCSINMKLATANMWEKNVMIKSVNCTWICNKNYLYLQFGNVKADHLTAG